MDTNETPTPPATSPEEELAAQKEALKKMQNQIAELNQSAGTIQTRIKALQAKIAEVNQAIAGYDALSQAMAKQLSEAKHKIAQKTGIAETVIKDRKSQIDQTIEKFNEKLEKQAASVKEAFDASQKAVSASKDADALVTQAQASYEARKKSPKDTEASLKELTALLDQAGKAETQGEYGALYFLVKEANALAEKISIEDAGAFEKALRAKQDDAENAKNEAAEKKLKADRATESYLELKRAYETAKVSRRSDILKALKESAPPN